MLIQAISNGGTTIPPKPTNRSLITIHRLVIDDYWVDLGDLLVNVHDKRTGRQELLCIAPVNGINFRPSRTGVLNLIKRYIHYDLLSQEQFLCLTEPGKQDYIQIMRAGFYPRSCAVWMRMMLDFIDGKQESFITNYKTLKAWAQKERTKV